jgi:C-terminal processing protease CtpA/Prc
MRNVLSAVLGLCLLFGSMQAITKASGASFQDIGFDPEKKYSVEQLKEDFSLLRTALEEGHSGLYFYSSREDMDRLFDRAVQQMTEPLNEPEFLRLVTRVVAQINDGHTGVRSSEPYQRFLNQQALMLPFNLRFIQNKAYLFRNYSEVPELAMGGEVVSINGRTMPEILKEMLHYIPSDGHVETSKYRRLESTQYFGELYALLYGVTTSFDIVYLPPEESSPRKFSVEGVRSSSIDRIFQKRYPGANPSRPPMELDYRGDVAILTIRTFSDGPFRSSGIAYPTELRKAFQEMDEKGIERLIVDLRGNGGGADLNGRLLVSYLLDKPFMYYTHLEVNRDSFSFVEFTDAPELGEDLKKRLRGNDKGTYDVRFHPNLGERKPMQPGFRGRVLVLIDGRSFSASGECTSILHFKRRAEFVGEECGSGYYGNTSGMMPQLTLPHTRLRLRLPMVRYHMAVSGYADRNRGIIPDYPFSPSISDLLEDRDTELEYALDLFRK